MGAGAEDSGVRAGDGARPVCVECGYDLSGVGAAEEGRCPECGTPWQASEMFFLRPWPAWWRVLAWMGGPMVVLAVLGLGGALVAPHLPGWTVQKLGIAGLLVALLVCGVVPLAVAEGIVNRCRVRSRREVPRTGLWLLGLVLNVVILVMMLVVVAAWRG